MSRKIVLLVYTSLLFLSCVAVSFQYVKPVRAAIKTEIHFTLFPNPATSNDLITLLGNLAEADTGKPINDTQVDLYVNGTLRGNLWTNASGWFKNSGYLSLGVYIINVTYPGSGIYLLSSYNQTLHVFTKISTKTWFTLSPNPANVSQTITLIGNLTDKFNNPLGGENVEIYYSENNGTTWNHTETLTINATGWFQTPETLTQTGIYNVAVMYRGSDRYNVSYHIETLTVELNSYPEFLPTDLNKDGTVNILDISIVAMAFGTQEGDENYNVLADLDENGEVNILDISIVAMDYGKTI